MNNEIFRKKSLSKISSPEELNEYVRVTDPGVWVMFAAVVVLLIGVCVWGVFGRLDRKVECRAICESGTVYVLVPAEYGDKLSNGSTFTIDGTECGVRMFSYVSDLSAYVAVTDAYGYSDGEYKAGFTVESIRPMSFVFN